MEVKEAIQNLLRKAVKRINRLNNAIAQLEEIEQDIISMFYLERDLTELQMARTLGFQD
jgi:DNA-directed RNA polymerase specialized sigma subunit